MRRLLPIVALLATLAAACSPGKPDAAADLAAYQDLIPAAAPTQPALAPDLELQTAFDLGRLDLHGAMGWYYFNAHLLDDNGERWTMMFAYLWDHQFFGSLDLPDRKIHLPFYRRIIINTDLRARSIFIQGLSSLRQPAAGRLEYRFELNDPRVQLDLRLIAQRPPFEVAGSGRISMGQTGESRYAIIPGLYVSGAGVYDGKTVELRGLGWMDHQWGNWDMPALQGWRWHSIHLNNGMKIMIYQIYKQGSLAEALCDVVAPDGQLHANQQVIAKNLQRWKSRRTGKKWGAAWRIEIPGQHIVLEELPDASDREINPVIYEGGCFVSGTVAGAPVAGRAFYEEYQR
jgi:predicted secreted hydrolase